MKVMGKISVDWTGFWTEYEPDNWVGRIVVRSHKINLIKIYWNDISKYIRKHKSSQSKDLEAIYFGIVWWRKF